MADKEKTPRDQLDHLLGILKRSTRYIGVVALTAALGIAASVGFAFTRAQNYRSETVLLYREVIPANLLRDVTTGNRNLAGQFREMVSARPILEPIINDLKPDPGLLAARGMNAAIEDLIAYVRAYYSDEGLYVIEHILLRPEVQDERFLPICVDSSCTECFEDDPYSYRMHIVLPAYASRFASMDFRRFAEEVLREEAPAHVLPKICWIGQDDMARLERAYREFLEVKSGGSSVDRAQKQAALIEVLYAVKNVYPPERLRDCDATEAQRKFILGQSALGNHEHDEG